MASLQGFLGFPCVPVKPCSHPPPNLALVDSWRLMGFGFRGGGPGAARRLDAGPHAAVTPRVGCFRPQERSWPSPRACPSARYPLEIEQPSQIKITYVGFLFFIIGDQLKLYSQRRTHHRTLALDKAHPLITSHLLNWGQLGVG